MSELAKRIEEDLVAAMKEGDALTRDTLRMLKTGLKNREVEKMGTVTDEEVVAVIRKEAKGRAEAIEQFAQVGRNEQADKERQEKEILERYLPSEMSNDELEKTVTEAIAASGAASTADIGKVMKEVMPRVAGRAEGGRVSALVRSKLG
jgi:uncharacterized protein YqeY